MASQYTEQYLHENDSRGNGRGYTLQTFLRYHLRGKARQYSDRYLRALQHDLNSRRDVVIGKSVHNGVAYYRKMEN